VDIFKKSKKLKRNFNLLIPVSTLNFYLFLFLVSRPNFFGAASFSNRRVQWQLCSGDCKCEGNES
jgi:hypothetical protein